MAATNNTTFIFFFFAILLHGTCKAATTLPKFPAILFFGDSTVDTGNNNHGLSVFRADHYPYGPEFPGGVPTGRFSSGKIVPDFLASDFGIKETVPAYLDPTLSDNDLKTGVSFASGGSGYDDLTNAAVFVTTLSQQMTMFREYKHRLEKLVGRDEANTLVNDALVVISSGSNDFFINFYALPIRSLEFNVSGYQNFLQDRLRSYIQELYSLGCRTIAVVGLPPIGCVPLQRTLNFLDLDRSCVEEQNSDSVSYNQKLQKLVLPQLQKTLPGSKLLYIDIYQPLIKMINNPKKYGFKVTDRGCCGTGIFEAGPLCSKFSPPCQNPSEYIFWDSVHPGQAAYKYLTKAVEKQLLTYLPIRQPTPTPTPTSTPTPPTTQL